MTVAVILAGGSGVRVGGNIPKQFLKVAGKKVIEWTLDAFENNSLIDEICVVCNPSYIYLMEEISVKGEWKKLRKILQGGKERYLSSLVAINAYGDGDRLIFHDAVRPLVSEKIITETVLALKEWRAVDVAIKTTDTIIDVESFGDCKTITAIPDRTRLFNGQTPQAFHRSVIKEAYEIALKDKDFKVTDDCGVVKKYLPSEKIFVIDGETENMKITYEEDIFLIDKLFQLRRLNFDNLSSNINFQGKVAVIFGASYGIGKCIREKIEQYGGKVFGFSRSCGNVDVQNVQAIKNALQKVFNETGRIDFVVNTAGILQKQALNAMSESDVNLGVSVNYLGALNVARLSFSYLEQSCGQLLLFTSSSYTRGRMLYAIYSSTKAAVVNLTQSLAEEWQASKVRVNCICPERTKTPMRERNFGKEDPNTLCSPEKVADYTVAVLNSNITGEVVEVKK